MQRGISGKVGDFNMKERDEDASNASVCILHDDSLSSLHSVDHSFVSGSSKRCQRRSSKNKTGGR